MIRAMPSNLPEFDLFQCLGPLREEKPGKEVGLIGSPEQGLDQKRLIWLPSLSYVKHYCKHLCYFPVRCLSQGESVNYHYVLLGELMETIERFPSNDTSGRPIERPKHPVEPGLFLLFSFGHFLLPDLGESK